MAQGQGRTGDNRPDFIRYYLQFPPVTRTFLTAIVLISTLVHFGIISKYTLFTSFWGSLLRFFDAGWGLWFLMTLIICIFPLLLILGGRELMAVYQQSSQVEGYFSTPDYAWMLVLSGATIMTLSRLITPFGLYLPALQVAIAYRWSRLHPGASVHVYIINVPAQYYPWALLALSFILTGPQQAAVDFTGVLGAHLHLFLTEEWPRQGGQRWGTPAWFKALFPRGQATGGLRDGVQNRGFGTVIPPREPGASGVAGETGGSGNFRGQGHRLG